MKGVAWVISGPLGCSEKMFMKAANGRKARKKTVYWGIAMKTSGPMGYRAKMFMKVVGLP